MSGSRASSGAELARQAAGCLLACGMLAAAGRVPGSARRIRFSGRVMEGMRQVAAMQTAGAGCGLEAVARLRDAAASFVAASRQRPGGGYSAPERALHEIAAVLRSPEIASYLPSAAGAAGALT